MNKKGQMGMALIIVFIALGIVTLFFYILNPEEKSKYTDDELASRYIKKYYPEFENCTILYDNCLNKALRDNLGCYEGANIYCDDLLENRDGLKIVRKEPTRQIKFEGITLKQLKKLVK